MSLFYYSIYLFLYCFIRYLSFCFRGAKIRIIFGITIKRWENFVKINSLMPFYSL